MVHLDCEAQACPVAYSSELERVGKVLLIKLNVSEIKSMPQMRMKERSECFGVGQAAN